MLTNQQAAELGLLVAYAMDQYQAEPASLAPPPIRVCHQIGASPDISRRRTVFSGFMVRQYATGTSRNRLLIQPLSWLRSAAPMAQLNG